MRYSIPANVVYPNRDVFGYSLLFNLFFYTNLILCETIINGIVSRVDQDIILVTSWFRQIVEKHISDGNNTFNKGIVT